MESTDQKKKHLHHEYLMYKELNATTMNSNCEENHISRIYYYGSFLEPHFTMIIMSFFDRSVNDMFEKSHRRLTRETLLLIFLQTVKLQEKY